MVVKITNTVNTRGKQLIVRLNEVCAIHPYCYICFAIYYGFRQ